MYLSGLREYLRFFNVSIRSFFKDAVKMPKRCHFPPSSFRHMMCGTLHCQNGSQKPRLPQSTYSTHTQTVNGQEVQCKVTSGSMDPEFGEDLGMVQDGTKCGEDMVSSMVIGFLCKNIF
jgi:hypothetical protein